MLGGSKKVKAPGSLSPKTRPVDLTRKPKPPRIPKAKFQNMSQAQTAKFEKRKLESKQAALGLDPAETFSGALARQYKIMRPSFSSKNLRAKKEYVDEEAREVKRKRKELIL